ncbi:P-loop containing nucleoside triphosphate hydrolase protein [Trematosphaeria pertusa]|uniref:P-loop containing nucleoside triphosphate hydrolase protein n=1 Tax=Trematosphaeria pertusa TaxID=390896 RepID=A0A6A6I227_9PLEO|nr:P-loop containing nucleoside triphosphate hydrolase protein [Trematosphaeria pertusa]KAF2244209.1 P-loop containing nucleoside triphosphate hydrolase protein [Trematosphaeria pertusa]
MQPEPKKISVLGPPGSGKGTQCSLLQKRFFCAHLSVGDLLRAEVVKPGSPYAELIRENIKEGRIGPKELTVRFMKQAMDGVAKEGVQSFFLDGFPRRLDQAEYFEEKVGPVSLVLVLECPSAVLLERLLSRRRADDDTGTIQKRIDTFNKTTAQVLEKYEAMGKVVRVDGNHDVEKVAADIQYVLRQAGVELQTRAGLGLKAEA